MGNIPIPTLAAPIQTTYSFKDLVGVLFNPVMGTPFILTGGNVGIGEVSIRPLTQRTEHDVASDGTVMPSYVPGDNFEVTVSCQQTSSLHHALLSLFNLLITAANASDVSNWAATVLSFRTILDGSTHNLTGASFRNTSDKPYAQKGQNVTWAFMAAYGVNQ